MDSQLLPRASTSKGDGLENDNRYKLIWMKHHDFWWSAIILDKKVENNKNTAFIYGIKSTVKIIRKETVDFIDGFRRIVAEQIDVMCASWIEGVIEALKVLYKNEPDCINYDLRTLMETGLINFSKRKYDQDCTIVSRKKRSIIYVDYDFDPGSLVWAKYGDNWWSGMIIHKFPQGTTYKKYVVFWMADFSISEIHHKKVIDFAINFAYVINVSKTTSKSWKKGVVYTLNELFNSEKKFENENLKKLALKGLTDIPPRKLCVPEWIQNTLKKNNFNVGEIGSIDKKAKCPKSVKEIIQKKITRGGLIHGVCLACYTTNNVELEHPLFMGNVCNICLARLKSTMIVKGDDGLHYFCCVCGVLGLMIVCDNYRCGRAYCYQCISDLTKRNTWINLLAINNWFCFLCENSPFSGVIFRRCNYEDKIQELYCSVKAGLVQPPPKSLLAGKKLRVLSLFDGISAGCYALHQLNIPVETYYAAEIDVGSINITNFNFGNIVTQKGDVTAITEKAIEEMSPIHLLIGGSPCNDLSLVNPARKGLFDYTGSGILFFEYFRIILLLKKYNKDGFFWLFENVSSMQLSIREIISSYLECEPVLKDAISLSPQHRPRLFWGNLPSLYIQTPFDPVSLQSVLMRGRTALVPKLKTITTQRNSLMQGKDMFPVMDSRRMPDTIWITEMEKVFGFPPHYTDVGNLSVSQRQRALGKSWSIPIIMHLFNFLIDFCRDE
ncbi:hypothetical protein FQR65_LT11790 [Abscondita terminalis]|nr:hypothetical protein FQR65_LT11790 [Abscondita terminalis]